MMLGAWAVVVVLGPVLDPGFPDLSHAVPSLNERGLHASCAMEGSYFIQVNKEF